MPVIVQLLLSVITFILNTYLGLFVYLRNKKNWTNRLFFILTLLIDVYLITNFISLNPPQRTADQHLFWIRIVMFVTSFIGPTLFLLVHTFPQPKISLSKLKLLALLALMFTAAALSLTPFVFESINVNTDRTPIPQPGPAIPIFFLDFAGLFVLSTIFLVYKFRTAVGLVKTQIGYFLAGIAGTFSLMAISTVVFVVILKTSDLVFMGPISTIILVIFIAYSIVKHRFLDISYLVARAVNYTILLSVLAITFAASLFFVATQLFGIGIKSSTLVFSTGFALIIGFVLQPLQNLLTKATEKIFHKTSYSPEELLEKISEDIRSTLSLGTITNKIYQNLSNTIHPISMAFYFTNTKNKDVSTINFNFKTPPPLAVTQIEQLAKSTNKSILVFEELPENQIKQLLREIEISIVIPLYASNRYQGILILGPKSSGEIYNSQDINVLEILGPQISIAIQNSLAYDEIKKFNLTLKQKVKEATSDLRKANKDLRHLDKLKDEFVYIATHELKTPVTVIKGYMQMMQAGSFGKLSTKMKKPLSEMESATIQLITLVNDLLEIARSEIKTMEIQTQPTDLCTAVDETLSNLQPLAQQKSLKLSHTCGSHKLVVLANPDKLKEITNNLVTNAIKYSTKGTISVTHVVEHGQVITHVADQGHGISKKDQQKLFSRFFRAESTSKAAPGTGLGLFIVKQIIEKMGGKIWFTSTLGKGTTFSFSLPVSKQKAPTKKAS